MKFTFNPVFALGLLFAGLIFTGCASPNDSFFSDMPDNNSAIVSSGNSANVAPQNSPVKRSSVHENDLPPEVAKFQIGDTVTVAFSGLPVDLAPHTEPIKEDGTIELPNIDKVVAAGKTAGELQNEIHNLYVPSLYRHLTVTVSTGDRVYYVRGEVKGGGRQLYVGQTSVMRAIASAGDFSDFANHKNVLLVRANGKQMKVNCDRIMEGKDPDPPVYPGDQIVVKRRIF